MILHLISHMCRKYFKAYGQISPVTLQSLFSWVSVLTSQSQGAYTSLSFQDHRLSSLPSCILLSLPSVREWLPFQSYFFKTLQIYLFKYFSLFYLHECDLKPPTKDSAFINTSKRPSGCLCFHPCQVPSLKLSCTELLSPPKSEKAWGNKEKNNVNQSYRECAVFSNGSYQKVLSQ